MVPVLEDSLGEAASGEAVRLRAVRARFTKFPKRVIGESERPARPHRR